MLILSELIIPIQSICFVDANIIFYIEKLKDKASFLTVLEQVYESVYIHEEVYNELSIAGQRFVDTKCEMHKWILFKPVQEFQHVYEDYMLMLSEIQSTLVEIDMQRGKEWSAGTGEIASLAAAYLLNAEFICSNDYSIEEVIKRTPLHIYIDGDDSKEPVLIKHHRLVDFCKLVVEGSILPRSIVRKFFQIAHIELKMNNRKKYDERIVEFDQLIPIK